MTCNTCPDSIPRKHCSSLGKKAWAPLHKPLSLHENPHDRSVLELNAERSLPAEDLAIPASQTVLPYLMLATSDQTGG